MEMVFKPDVVLYFILSILIGIVAYFLKQLHKDFKRMEKDLSEVKTTTALIRSEFKNIQDLMSQKIEFLEKRVKYVANLFIKSNGKEKFDLTERLKAPTSKFFRTIRNIGLCLAAIGGAIVAAPVALPATIVTVAGYLTVAGGVMTAVAQATVEDE